MIPRYSPVAPIKVLEHLAECEVHEDRLYLGGYLLMLAHEVLDHQASYRTLAGDVRHRYGEHTFIMMDNSVVELGKPMHVEEVVEAADIVRADCIMTPDVLGSLSRTRQVVNSSFHQLVDCGFELMKIPQGSSMVELFDCVDWLRTTFETQYATVDYWGIPRWVANKLVTRKHLINYIKETGHADTRIHLLGMSNDIEDDLRCVKMWGVMGIDSANPLVNGHMGYVLDRNNGRHWERGNFWECTVATEKMKTNVSLMHEWVST